MVCSTRMLNIHTILKGAASLWCDPGPAQPLGSGGPKGLPGDDGREPCLPVAGLDKSIVASGQIKEAEMACGRHPPFLLGNSASHVYRKLSGGGRDALEIIHVVVMIRKLYKFNSVFPNYPVIKVPPFKFPYLPSSAEIIYHVSLDLQPIHQIASGFDTHPGSLTINDRQIKPRPPSPVFVSLER